MEAGGTARCRRPMLCTPSMGADLEVKVLSGGGRPYSSLRQGHHCEVMFGGSPVGKLTA